MQFTTVELQKEILSFPWERQACESAPQQPLTKHDSPEPEQASSASWPGFVLPGSEELQPTLRRMLRHAP